jgi:hypothetical protein
LRRPKHSIIEVVESLKKKKTFTRNKQTILYSMKAKLGSANSVMINRKV